MTYNEAYKMGTDSLKHLDESQIKARLLLEYVCNTGYDYLFLNGDKEISNAEEEEYKKGLERLLDGEPLQYITGFQEFMGLKFKISHNTLIPRQDTECVVEEAMKHLHDGMSILDVGTGTGCILLSLLKYSNDCTGQGVDISAEALETARFNAAKLGFDESRVKFYQSDMFDSVEGKFNMIISNPPYIKDKDIESLNVDVKNHEPITALSGGEDGLKFYRIIAKKAREHLTTGGVLVLEIGYDEGEDVKNLLLENNWKNVEIKKDLAGLDRTVIALV
ncbi:MAG: peptide chain release factor N(5)-glutamine methyltransferase [Lachnospiraceae bacterium]|nr:peptide chain release factor N(5)-glutamine methyltransferase [Lachnospiraceae bacterium]